MLGKQKSKCENKKKYREGKPTKKSSPLLGREKEPKQLGWEIDSGACQNSRSTEGTAVWEAYLSSAEKETVAGRNASVPIKEAQPVQVLEIQF